VIKLHTLQAFCGGKTLNDLYLPNSPLDNGDMIRFICDYIMNQRLEGP
jgi:hypothetical protein